jgi:hypothetical protein
MEIPDGHPFKSGSLHSFFWPLVSTHEMLIGARETFLFFASFLEYIWRRKASFAEDVRFRKAG